MIVFQLYCQNLSLFGKFFIDVKTLFFDCENCVSNVIIRGSLFINSLQPVMFYLMTDATSKRDHVLAFFSKVRATHCLPKEHG